MNTFIKLMILSVLLISITALSDDQQTQCTENRPTSCMVTSVNFVCGVNKDGSKKSYFDPCFACKEETTVSYSSGKCASSEKVMTDSVTPVIPNANNNVFKCGERQKECLMMIVILTCGIDEQGNEQQFTNGCLACKNDSIEKYYYGECKNKQNLVNEDLAIELPSTSKPQQCLEHERQKECFMEIIMLVCGVNSNGNKQTFSNPCLACKDTQVNGYTMGECKKASNLLIQQKVITRQCQIQRPKLCAMMIIFPVCGKKLNGQEITYDNPCEACKDTEVINYDFGKC